MLNPARRKLLAIPCVVGALLTVASVYRDPDLGWLLPLAIACVAGACWLLWPPNRTV